MTDTFRALCAELVDAWLKGDDIVGAMNRARAALGEADEPAVPAPPADGEVAKLVAKLRRLAPQNPLGTADPTITRAADLLERQAPLPEVDQMAWQPIDTAPRDGTEILASDYDAIEIVSWVGPRFDVGITGEWTNREGEAMYPAWWQPLPDHLSLPGQEVDNG